MQTNVQKGGWVEYHSNNSGGSWWLSDEDWKNLEEAGWEVDWYKDRADPLSGRDNPEGRFLGALASSAKRYGVTLRHAVAEWEAITGECATDEGCPCCGTPHSFYFYSSSGKMLDSIW